MTPAGRGGSDFIANPLLADVGPAGLVTLFFGRTKGSAAFGRRIRKGGAPFEPVGVRTLASGVDVLIVPLITQSNSGVRNQDLETHVSQSGGDTDQAQDEKN